MVANIHWPSTDDAAACLCLHAWHCAAKQQHALLCFLAMMGGVLALNGTRFAQQWPRAKYVVLLLAAANGLVGVALQLQGSMAQRPSWMHALPWA